MSGRTVAILIVVVSALAGMAMYYLQVYGFYRTLDAPAELTVLGTDGAPVAVPFADFEGIDADSSPIRYRACFRPDLSGIDLDTLEAAVNPAPRNAPFWFRCFDAQAIGAALESGTARAFVAEKNVHYGVDRIVAITDDGRGYIWNDLNDCGQKAYDGTVIGEECPPRPEEAK